MKTSSLAESYLAISEGLSLELDGLRWSHGVEAIETAASRTVLLREPLVQILKGAFSTGKIPSFDSVLLVCYALFAREEDAGWIRDLKTVFQSKRNQPNRYVHLGSLIAHLARHLPGPETPPSIEQIQSEILQRSLSTRPFPRESAWPAPVPPREIQRVIVQSLRSFSNADLERWIRFGEKTPPNPKTMVEELDALPQRVVQLLRQAQKSGRLAAAVTLVPWLEAALSWPDESARGASLEIGGFAQIATRGDPSRLLVSQLALDPEEFLRRFAEGELLFFEKETPHERPRPERVLLVDQGVRTWGRVRWALAGAALTLIRRQGNQGETILLKTTGDKETWDLSQAPLPTLVETLEGADHSQSPVPALKDLISQAAKGPREVYLLTHARTLEENELARFLGQTIFPGRLLCLGVEEAGWAVLAEWEETTLKVHRRFRVDWDPAEKAKGLDSSPVVPNIDDRLAPWTGPVESVSLPVCGGVIGSWSLMAFSADGQWLVGFGSKVHCKFIQAWDLSTKKWEVLPNPRVFGRPFFPIDVFGFQDGVVFYGTMDLQEEQIQHLWENQGFGDARTKGLSNGSGTGQRATTTVAVHYNRFKRQVRVLPLCKWVSQESMNAVPFPDLHCLVLLMKTKIVGWDLSQNRPTESTPATGPRLEEAFRRARQAKWMAGKLPVVREGRGTLSQPIQGPRLVIQGNALEIRGGSQDWESFTPMQDGKPLLEGYFLDEAVLAGETLALKLLRHSSTRIVLMEGPKGKLLGEIGDLAKHNSARMRLSANSTFLAVTDNRPGCRILETRGNRQEVFNLPYFQWSKIMDFSIQNNPFGIFLVFGKKKNLFFDISKHGLSIQANLPRPFPSHPIAFFPIAGPGLEPERFQAKSSRPQGWFFARDSLGPLVLFDPDHQIVASFAGIGRKGIVWSNQGLIWGDPSLTGVPNDPQVAKTLGEFLYTQMAGMSS